ncbi:MAG: class II aldolase/adducin family protein [Thermodesulfobacteria bacterium]|nr:class II aldolase/adducin family protein [Thermodesulfobacteriota bacterium]
MRFPRTTLAEFARRAARAGLVTGPEGNLSLKVKEEIFITPANVAKEDLRPEDISVVDLEGNLLEGKKPSSEIKMHLEIYASCPDVAAVIHAHPPYTLGLELAGEDVSKFYLPEGLIYLRKVAVVPPTSPGSEELAKKAAEAAKEARVIVLSRHGAVTLGKNLSEAFDLMLLLEKISRITWLAKALKKDLAPLSEVNP